MINQFTSIFTTARPGNSKLANGVQNGLSAAGVGATIPFILPSKIGSRIGIAFGRMISIPLGVVQKGYMMAADQFRGPFMKPSIRSSSYYSGKIAIHTTNVCGKIGRVAGYIATVLLSPVCLACAPVTSILGGLAGLIGTYRAQSSLPAGTPEMPLEQNGYLYPTMEIDENSDRVNLKDSPYQLTDSPYSLNGSL